MAKRKPAKSKNLTNKMSLSKKQLTLFVAIFALVGGFVIWRSFALVSYSGRLEAEKMSLPSNAKVIADSTASNGKSVIATGSGKLKGTINVTSDSHTTISSDVLCSTNCIGSTARIVAYVGKCTDVHSFPQAYKVSVKLDGTQYMDGYVSATSWQTYSAGVPKLIGKHEVVINFVPYSIGKTGQYTVTESSISRCVLHLDYSAINHSGIY